MIRFACRTKVGGNITRPNNLFGRQKIYASVKKEDLSVQVISKILQEVLPIHKKNVTSIKYLRKVFKGNQEIYSKTKVNKVEINNKVVENHIDHAVSFKKGYVFGYPIQYIQSVNEADSTDMDNLGNEPTISKELSNLNTWFKNNNKASKDLALSETLFVCGVAPRLVVPKVENKLKPFEFYNLEPENAFVVYSNSYKEERLFGVYMVRQKDYIQDKEVIVLQVTTDTNVYEYTLSSQSYDEDISNLEAPVHVNKNDPTKELNVIGTIPIVEYELNRERISLVEKMLDGQNMLNQLTSNELDDVEQFVQAMLVFINAEIDADTVSLAKELGAINIKSDNPNGAESDVKLLTSKLAHTDSKVLYDRVLQTLLTNVGVPLNNTSGGSGGDTGLARLADNGWLMADTKAREDELAFIESEYPFLEVVLAVLKVGNLSKDLDISNIATKFTRNKSDNLLTKVQALQSMKGIVHPELAFELANVFSDSNEAVQRSKSYFGEDFYKLEVKEQTKGFEPTEKVDENK